MAKMGLYINYEYCTGCQSCAVACQQEHDFPAGKCGITVTEFVYPVEKKPVAVDFLPFPNELCDLCIRRHQQGEDPACVKHCQAACMMFGSLEQLVKEMEKTPRSVLFSPR